MDEPTFDGRSGRPARRRRSEGRMFLAQLLRNPAQVSALAPSSRRLAREMAASVPRGAVTVAEFGAGTGRLTRALLHRGIKPANLHAFEINPIFAARLRAAFPGVIVHEGPAQDLLRVGPARVDAVVSGLPLLSMSDAVQGAVVNAAFARLGPEGVFIQFTYGPVSPVSPGLMRELGLVWRRSRRIWANLPPAVVYVYAREGAGLLRTHDPNAAPEASLTPPR